MKTYPCTCGATLHFENSQCLACGKPLGFLPDELVLSPLEPAGDNVWRAAHPAGGDGLYRMCANYVEHAVCNWMVPADDAQQFCRACRVNHIIPNLSEPKNRLLWYRIETAKRRLFYTLLALGLPIVDRHDDPEAGLAFEFLADPDPSVEFSDSLGGHSRVMTGHHGGKITINLAEADPSAREGIREQMNELYRTLLGHFRHEIGHYYWNRLVESTPWLEQARVLFGDERQEYADALERYYRQGPATDWPQHYISAYASAHPWEDWAETWAHYLHMVDTLETAHDFGYSIRGRTVTQPSAVLKKNAMQHAYDPAARNATFDTLLGDWINLTVAMNALNRSMGLPDAYPFVLLGEAAEKLRFVHRLIRQSVNHA